MACSQGTSAILTLGGVDYRSGDRYVSYETIKGGFGARPTKDGITGVAAGISNTMNTPIEILEMSFPVRVDRYEIVADSGGIGRLSRRMRRRARLANPRQSLPVQRVSGAHQVRALRACRRRAGGTGRITLIGPDGAERELNSKGSFTAAPRRRSACARRAPAASARPRERERDRLRDDVINGYVSPGSAARTMAIATRTRSNAPRAESVARHAERSRSRR